MSVILQRSRETKLLADDVSLRKAKVDVTNGPPFIGHENLYLTPVTPRICELYRAGLSGGGDWSAKVRTSTWFRVNKRKVESCVCVCVCVCVVCVYQSCVQACM